MSKPDDLDAVRQIATILEPFDDPSRERILRWVREKIGMQVPGSQAPVVLAPPASGGPAVPPTVTSIPGGRPQDIRSFVEAKNPKNETQLAATVAYYYQFLAPEGQRKDSITADDLLEACRVADRKRPARPAQTMVNAYGNGVFDKLGKGTYRLNSVGENLVAMVLPGDGTEGNAKAKKGGRRKPARATKLGGAKAKKRSASK